MSYTTIDGVTTGGKTERRISALKRLEKQLVTVKKVNKERDTVDLTITDVIRINKEINILKSKI